MSTITLDDIKRAEEELKSIFHKENEDWFSGMRAYPNIDLPSTTDEPNKKHKYKRWMRMSYHKRIQKKWVKRWGSETKPFIIQTEDGIYCHPSVYEQIKQGVNNRLTQADRDMIYKGRENSLSYDIDEYQNFI